MTTPKPKFQLTALLTLSSSLCLAASCGGGSLPGSIDIASESQAVESTSAETASTALLATPNLRACASPTATGCSHPSQNPNSNPFGGGIPGFVSPVGPPGPPGLPGAPGAPAPAPVRPPVIFIPIPRPRPIRIVNVEIEAPLVNNDIDAPLINTVNNGQIGGNSAPITNNGQIGGNSGQIGGNSAPITITDNFSENFDDNEVSDVGGDNQVNISDIGGDNTFSDIGGDNNISDNGGDNTFTVSDVGGDNVISDNGGDNTVSIPINDNFNGTVDIPVNIPINDNFNGTVDIPINADTDITTTIEEGAVDVTIGGKIVCTAMNAAYGFGSFRNLIWLKYAKDHLTKEHELGYHALFLPLVHFAFKQGDHLPNRLIRQVLEHIARHRSVDLRAEMRGSRRDRLGRLYRALLEPTCFAVGSFLVWKAQLRQSAKTV